MLSCVRPEDAALIMAAGRHGDARSRPSPRAVETPLGQIKADDGYFRHGSSPLLAHVVANIRISALSGRGQPPGRTRRVAVDHLERRAPFGAAIGPGKIAPHDQARPVLHQGMTDEAQHRPGAGDFL